MRGRRHKLLTRAPIGFRLYSISRPRACRLHEGLCFVRAQDNNQIALTSYGRPSGLCIDPIEKKPLNHYLTGTPILSFGSAGCQCELRRREMYRWMDAANVDLKAFTDNLYHKICGGHLQPVLDTLVYLKKATNIWFEIMTLLISDENHSG